MTQANQDPEVFLTQVNDAIEEVEDAIDAFLDASLNLINSAIAGASAHFHGIGGAIKGFFTGGPGGAVAGYIESFTNELSSSSPRAPTGSTSSGRTPPTPSARRSGA